MKYKFYLLKKRLLKGSYALICAAGFNHADWLRRHHVFQEIGTNFFFQPNRLPNEPKLIKIHNNVKIATNVTFFNHDVINAVFADMDKTHYSTHAECIEIFDNVFIGGNCTILGGVRIGPNAIVAAGSIVTTDVPAGKIVGGNPAKVIGSFNELKKKRVSERDSEIYDPEEIKDKLWEKFKE